jgi:glycosyltransferase involved in cell wall biosynthesis
MRALHLSMTGWNEREGIARAIAELVRRSPHEHHYAGPGRPVGHFDAVHPLPARVIPAPWSRRLAEVLRASQPDLVHVHGGEAAPLFALCRAAADVPVVVSIYGRATRLPRVRPSLSAWRDLRSTPNGGLRRAAISALSGPATRLALATGRVAVVCTPDEAVAHRFAGSAGVVLARGAASRRPRLARWSDAPVIAFAGRAERARGLDDLLEAFALVRLTLPTARLRLHLLPGPSNRDWADAPDGVEVVTASSSDLEADLAGAQVVALPFRFNVTMTPPLVAAEAMSVGVPVVASDVAGLTPLVRDGVNGRVVRPGDPVGLAAALCAVVADPAAWESLASGAHRTIADGWSWDHAAAAVAAAYDAVLDGRRPAPATPTSLGSTMGPAR